MTNPALLVLLPHAIVIAAACLLLLLPPRGIWNGRWSSLWAVAIFIAAGATQVWAPPTVGDLAEIRNDTTATELQSLFLAAGALLAALNFASGTSETNNADTAAMLLWSIAGGMLVSLADDTVLLSVALPFANAPLVLLLYNSRRPGADEATLKFAFIAGLSWSLTGFGFALNYAATGSTALSSAGTWETNAGLSVAALMLIVIGQGILLGSVPFHLAYGDIADGSDAWRGGVILIVPRLAAAAVLVRICEIDNPTTATVTVSLLLILAVTTLLGGGLGALSRRRVWRLLADVSVAQTGFWLLGLAVLRWWSGEDHPDFTQRARTFWFAQLAASTTSMIGMTAAVVFLSGRAGRFRFTDELTGLGRTRPVVAVAMSVLLFSLAGLPPLAGFWTQAGLCWSALTVHSPTAGAGMAFHPGFVVAALAGLAGNLLTAAVAMRLMNLMFLHSPLAKPAPAAGKIAVVIAVTAAVAIVAAGAVPEVVWSWLMPP